MQQNLKLQTKHFEDLTNLRELKTLNDTKNKLAEDHKIATAEIKSFIDSMLNTYSTTFYKLKKFDNLISSVDINNYTIFDIKLSDYNIDGKRLLSEILEQIAEEYCLIRPNYMEVYNNPNKPYSMHHSMFGSFIGSDFRIFADVQNKKFYVYNDPKIEFDDDKIIIQDWITSGNITTTRDDWYGWTGLDFLNTFQRVLGVVYSDFIWKYADKKRKDLLSKGVNYILDRFQDNFKEAEDRRMFGSELKLNLMTLEININNLSIDSNGF